METRAPCEGVLRVAAKTRHRMGLVTEPLPDVVCRRCWQPSRIATPGNVPSGGELGAKQPTVARTTLPTGGVAMRPPGVLVRGAPGAIVGAVSCRGVATAPRRSLMPILLTSVRSRD